jgi:beta-lactam-binding protein with PASTA domain
VGPPTSATTVVPPVSGPPIERPPAPVDDDRGPRTGLLVLLGLLVIALVVGGVLLWPKLFPPPIEQDEVPILDQTMTETEAREAIGDAGLAVGQVTPQASETVRANRVIPGSQDPTAGQFVDPGTAVSFSISTGKPQVTIPIDLVGKSRDEVKQQLTALGLVPREEEQKSDEPEGTVIATQPAPGEAVTAGTTVVIAYSDGRETLPNLVGRSREEAEQIVKDLGFVPRIFEEDDTLEPAGTVIEQDPPAGQEYDDETIVYLTVSTYVEPPPPPETTPTDPATTPTDPATSPSLPTDIPSIDGERSTPPVSRGARRTTGRAGRRTPGP